MRNILFSIATISAGYHVIILEGLGEAIEKLKVQKVHAQLSHFDGISGHWRFFNGEFWEGTLLILIFSGAHFWKVMQKEEVNEKSRNYSN